MAKNYYVIDGEDNTIWHGKEKDDGPMSFATFAAAEKSAKVAAQCAPGTDFKIVKVEAIVCSGVNPPKTIKVT